MSNEFFTEACGRNEGGQENHVLPSLALCRINSFLGLAMSLRFAARKHGYGPGRPQLLCEEWKRTSGQTCDQLLFCALSFVKS